MSLHGRCPSLGRDASARINDMASLIAVACLRIMLLEERQMTPFAGGCQPHLAGPKHNRVNHINGPLDHLNHWRHSHAHDTSMTFDTNYEHTIHRSPHTQALRLGQLSIAATARRLPLVDEIRISLCMADRHIISHIHNFQHTKHQRPGY